MLDHYQCSTVDDEDASIRVAQLQTEQKNIDCKFVEDSFRPTTDEFLASADGDKQEHIRDGDRFLKRLNSFSEMPDQESSTNNTRDALDDKQGNRETLIT